MRFRKSALAISFGLVTGLSGCAINKPVANPDDPAPLQELAAMSIKTIGDAVTEVMDEASRLSAVHDIGMKAGRQAGLEWRNGQINKELAELNRELSIAFNFEQVLIAGSYLPPRVDIVRGEVRKTENGDLNVVRLGYRIATEPMLVTQRPSHLNYLYRLPIPRDEINNLGMPRIDNEEELQVWNDAIREGWKQGVRHANIAFTEDVNLLHRDFGGILRYIELANKGIVAMPDISKDDRGIVMSSDGRILNVGDEVIAIDSSPLFQSTAKWKALGESLSEDSEGMVRHD